MSFYKSTEDKKTAFFALLLRVPLYKAIPSLLDSRSLTKQQLAVSSPARVQGGITTKEECGNPCKNMKPSND